MKKICVVLLFAAGGVYPAVAQDSVAETDTLVYKTADLGEIVVLADRSYTRKLLAPQQIFTFPKDAISFSNKQNMGDLFMDLGTVAVQKSQQGGGSPVLRGFEASRVLLVVDGVRMNNLIYRNGHLQNSITVDQFMLENVEVLNGPSSLNYGSDALGGTVVFNSRKPKLGSGLGGNAVLRYGSVNNEGTAHIDLNYGDDRFASLTSFTYSHFGDLKGGRNRNPFLPEDDGYIVCNGYVKPGKDGDDTFVENDKPYLQMRSGYEQYDIAQKFLFKPNASDSHSLNFQLSNTGNISRYDRLSEMKGGQPKYAEWYYGPQFRMMAAYNYEAKERLGADKSVMTLAYQKVKESRHNRSFRSETLNNRWEDVDMLTLNTDWIKTMGRNKVHAGVDGMLSFLSSTANLENVATGEISANQTRYPDGKNVMHSAEAYVMHTLSITPELTMTDGVRLGYSYLYSSVLDESVFPFFGGEDLTRRNFTYSLAWGLNYLPTKDWKTSVSASTAYRVPNVDTASKVFDSKTGTVTIPNPSLKPEKTLSVEANVTRHVAGRFSWENVVFATLFYDAITTARGTFAGSDKMMYDGVECDVYTSVNSRRAFLWGVSSNMTWRPADFLELSGTLNYTYGTIIGEDKRTPLDHIPPLFGRVGAEYISHSGRWRLGFYMLYNGRKSADRFNLDGEDNIDYATMLGEEGEGMPAWYTLNVKGSYDINRNLVLQCGVENLLDTEYRVFASGINAPGRNIYVALRCGF